MPVKEELISGKYIYRKNGREYSEENFKIFHVENTQGNFFINSEILSRVSTGEFLKVQVDYELSREFDPFKLKIRRSLGRRQSVERYDVDPKNHNIRYSFRGDNSEESYEKIVNGKFFITTPSFCTSTMMTMGRRFDPLQKTQYHILSSRNILDFEEPFQEGHLIIEHVQAEQVEITLNNQNLKSTLIHLYKQNKNEMIQEERTPFYLSKHMNLPYRAKINDDVTIEVDNLRIHESKNKGIFN